MDLVKSLLVPIVIIAFVFYMIKQMFFSSSAQEQKKAVDDIVVNKAKLSFPTYQYPLIANQLLEYMNGIGTQEKEILKTFQGLKTPDDLSQVIKSFGVKKYYINGLADGIATQFMGDPLDLQGWLTRELNETWLTFVRKEYRRLKSNALG